MLIAHPSKEARRSLRSVLVALSAVVRTTGTAAGALAAARTEVPDVVLLHRELAGVLPDIKQDPDLFRAPVLLIGVPDGVRAALADLERGAHDVLRENASDGEIAARVHAARRVHDMHDQLLSREHELETLAYHDELTGLPNRRFALRQLNALLSRARRHDQDVSVLLIDADRFKALNDRHGHQAGDEILCRLAARLAERVREEDIVARFGGEEFLVILPDTDASGAGAVAEDLRAAVAAERFPAGRLAHAVTVSVGRATWLGEDIDALVARADRGLYAAKEAGRNRVREDPAGAGTASR